MGTICYEDMLELLSQSADEAIAVLSSTDSVRDHFASDIEGLRRQKKHYGRRWRVALIGVTSSGKSTLVNALLGERLIPARVRPSTNCFVICRRSATLSATVFFDDGRTKVVQGDEVQAQLNTLADEVTNPNNAQHVREILIESPGFILRENMDLIDTPGLDAYGYEAHERLAIQELMPTVDMVVFVTTAKSTSDKIVSDSLSHIADERKPLVMVQTMADAIEPKLGEYGQYAKDRHEVAQEHRRRLSRLLETHTSPDVQLAEIYQLSAKEALERGTRDSGDFISFNEGISRCIDRLAPAFMGDRGRRLILSLRRIVETERQDSKPSGQIAALKRQIEQLERTRTAVQLEVRQFSAKMEDFSREADDWAKGMRQKLDLLCSPSPSEANELAKHIQKGIPGANALTTHLSAHQREMKSLCADLDLPFEEMAQPSLSALKRLGEDGYIERSERTDKIEKRGFWSWVKRKLRLSGGWEEEKITEEKVDVAKLRTLMEKEVREESAYWAQEAARLEETARRNLDTLSRSLLEKVDSYKGKLLSALDQEARNKVATALLPIMQNLERGLPSIGHKSEMHQDAPSCGAEAERKVLEVPRYVVNLARLSDCVARRRFLSARDRVLQRVANRYQRMLLWSFDPMAIERTLDLFFYDRLRHYPAIEPGIKRLPTPDGSAPLFALFEPSRHTPSPIQGSRLEEIFSVPTLVFLIVGILQVGSSQNQIAHSRLLSVNGTSRPWSLVAVADSIDALSTGIDLAEGLKSLKQDLLKEFGLLPKGVLAVHENPLMSLLADSLVMDGVPLGTLKERTQFLNSLGVKNDQERALFADTIQTWSDMGARASYG